MSTDPNAHGDHSAETTTAMSSAHDAHRDVAQTETTATEPTKKPRSAVERVVVWGLITVLAVITGIEYWSRSAFTSDYNAIVSAIEKSDESNAAVTEADVKQLLTRFISHDSEANLAPNDLAANRVDTYTYPGFLKGSPVLYVYYGVPQEGETTEVIKATTEQAGFIPKSFIKQTAPEEGGDAN